MDNTWHDTGYGPVPENLFRKKKVELTYRQKKELSTKSRDRALRIYNEKYNPENI